MQTPAPETAVNEIRAVEPPRVRHLLIYYFLQGLGLSLFFVVANTLFLSSFVAADLPGATLISAGVVLVVGRLYDMVAQRVAMRGRASLLIFMALSAVLFYAATQSVANTWVPFALFIWYKVLFTLSDLEFWGLSNLFFDTRESKSLFGWINMREVPAKVVGYFSVGFLVQVMDIPMLLVIAAVAFFINFFILRRLLDPRYAKEPKAPQTRADVSLFRFNGKGLLLLLGALSFVSVIIFTIINFSFLSLVEDKLHKTTELAAYLGVVLGTASFFTAVGKTLATNKVIARIGAVSSMLVLPLFMIAATALLLFRKSGPEEHYLTYYIVMLAGGRVFREVLFQPVFVSLAQPLPNHIRQRSYVFIKTLAEPLGMAAASILIYYSIRRLPLPDLDMATFVIMLLAVAMSGLVFLTFRRYISTFRQALASRTLVTRAIDSFNSFSQAIIREKLESHIPEEVMYAHKICAEANTHFFEMDPGRLLRHESAEVRLYALQQMTVDTPFSDTDILIYLSVKDPSLPVRQAAIEHLGARYKDSFADEYNALLEHKDLKLREAALRGLMESGNPEIIMIAGQKLNELIASPEAELNMVGASIIGDIRLQTHYKYLHKFFTHLNIAVRKAAIVAAGKLAHPQLLPELFGMIGQKAVTEELTQAIAQYRHVAITYLLEHKDVIAQHPAAVLRLSRRFEDKVAAGIIGTHLLPIAENALLDDCLQALYEMRVDKVETDKGVMELKLVNTGSFLYTCLYYIDIMEADAVVLKEALQAEVKNVKRRLLLLLSLMYERKEFNKIIAVYDQGGNNKDRLSAMLGGILDANHKKRFLPVYELSDNDTLKDYLKQFYTATITEDASDAILVGAGKSRFLTWTQAAALYTYLLALSDEVLTRYKDHEDAVITEMVQLALSRKPFVLRMIGDDTNGVFNTDNADPLLKIERIMVLKTIPIFEHFTQDMLEAISSVMLEQRFKANELVYKEGEPGDYIFIIYYGAVSMYNGVQEIMQQGGKEVFVKIATEDQKLASAKAQTESLLFCINKRDIEALKDEQPAMVRNTLMLFTTL